MKKSSEIYKINKIFKWMQGEIYLFPPTHSRELKINKYLSYETYFDDDRDYFYLTVNYFGHKIEIQRLSTNDWKVSHLPDVKISWGLLLYFFESIKKYFEIQSNIEKKQIQEKKSQLETEILIKQIEIENLKKELL